MSTTEKIFKTAGELGKMIAEHEASVEMRSVEAALKDDIETQRMINDFERHAVKLNEKQQKGEPIEIAEKHQLQGYQEALGANPLVRRLQKAQMDYLDLLQKVNVAIADTSGGNDGE